MDIESQGSTRHQQIEPILEFLLTTEAADRDIRTIKYQLKTAKLPIYRDLVGFVFDETPIELVNALKLSISR